MSSMPYFYIHSAIILSLLAIIGAAIGCYFGWLLWRNCQERVIRLQRENELVQAEIARTDALLRKVNSLST